MDKENREEKRGRGLVIFYAAVFVLADLFIFFLYLVAGSGGIGDVLSSGYFWLTEGVADGGIAVAILMLHRVDAGGIALQANDLENTAWLTPRKMKKFREFKVFPLRDAGRMEDAIVIGAKKQGRDVEITACTQMHALIVGTTGSGKTTGFADQNIAVLSMVRTKPSIIVSDPKRELYEKHAASLRARGYKVQAIDLRDPYSSSRWNPMQVLTRRIRLVRDLEYNLQYEDGRYYAAGETFLTFRDARMRRQQLMDEIYENGMDLIYTLCPVKNRDQPSWEEGARNLIFAFLLAMCEDCIKGKINEKQMVLFNLYHNITKYCSEDAQVLKDYLLEGREDFSKVKGMANTVLLTSDRTLACYLSEVNRYMQQLADDGILSLTCENDIDIINMDEGPNAVFMVIPDERVTRHRFVSLFITQMYKELVEKANINARRGDMKSAELKRHTYFVLDEFGNLPRFENADQMVTVARSRGIRFLFVLQSFAQLSSRYGRETAEVIKSNCNIKIFIGSDDKDTRREFSELCGQKKIKSLSVSTNGENMASSNTSASTRPLITPGMLERMNGDKKGDAVVSVRGYEPLKTFFTPSYELKDMYFPEGKCREERMNKDFKKEDYLFDICGAVDTSMCDEAMERLEQREEEELKDTLPLDELDAQWYAVKQQIDKTVEEVAAVLDDGDSATIRTIELNHLVRYLFALRTEYTKHRHVVAAITSAIDKIQNKLLPQMQEIQDKARSITEFQTLQPAEAQPAAATPAEGKPAGAQSAGAAAANGASGTSGAEKNGKTVNGKTAKGKAKGADSAVRVQGGADAE